MHDFEIIGKSREIKDILDIAGRVALSEASVLICGESGSGKELFARFIHRNSKRSNKRFVALNCAAIPEELLENELFGHKKGAFTDANEDYIGKFGYADGGIIFLDEISELNLRIQSKILRILQFKEYEPVGSSDSLRTDIRVIAATNKNLFQMVKKKTFREDLFYRLNVVPLEIPPLRNRTGDIGLLVDYFINIYNEKNNKKIRGITEKALYFLKSYNWPGNVRELQNTIERAVVLCSTDELDVDHLAPGDMSGMRDIQITMSLKDAVNNYKKKFIIEALERNHWNQTRTAKVLQIQRTYLSRLIKELNIDKI